MDMARSAVAFGFVTLLAATVWSPARADVVVLTFEGVGDGASIDNFYNGGTDSAGNSGTNYGVSFTSDSLGFISTLDGGSGNFDNSPSGDTISYFDGMGLATMDVGGGFTTGFSFYASSLAAGDVQVWSGLDGTGTVLADVPVTENNDNCPNPDYFPFCNWTPEGVTFAGTAESVVFADAAGSTGFDDVTLGSATPGAITYSSASGDPDPIPEPASMAVLAGGMLGIGVARSRRRA